MKTNLYINIIGALIVAVAVAGCSATTSNDKNARLAELKEQQANVEQEIKKLEEEIAKENPQPAAPVKMKEVAVKEVTPRVFDYYVQTQGSVQAVDNILVSARTAGIISSVFVREGDQVSKGQTLAQIDNSVIVHNIEEVKTSLEHANTVYERQKNLWEKKIGTEVQYLQAKNTRDGLEKRLNGMNEQLDMSRIKSPINGSVDEISLKIGENAAPGLPAFRVVSNGKLEMEADVSEAYVTDVKKGNRVDIIFPDINDTLSARVTFVGRTIDQLSRTFPIEVALPAHRDLRSNMSGVLKVVFQTEKAALVVPVNVVQDINNEKVVYVAEQSGDNMVARRRVVEVAGVYGNQAQIKSGLKSGDKVITVGYQGLNDGELVKI